jgi:hypothetical protein
MNPKSFLKAIQLVLIIEGKTGYSMKTKKAIIVISLVDEAQEENNEAIEKEIFQELSKEPPKIPWCKKVEKVEVAET